MLRYSTGLDVAAMFITHVHGDRVLGIPGLLRTMEFYERSTPLDVYTPRDTGSDVGKLVDVPGVTTTFPVEVTEVEGGERVVEARRGVVEAFETEHRTRSVGYRIVEPGRAAGECSLVNTGDTRPTETTVSAAAGADLLVHDGMFEGADGDRARRTGHSTSREAAAVAVRAGVGRLALTHVSSRHADDVSRLEGEAVEVFGNEAFVPRDGETVDVPE